MVRLWQSQAIARVLRDATERFSARKWLVALTIAGLSGFVAFGGLAWQAGIIGALAFVCAAVFLPRGQIVRRNAEAGAQRSARESRVSSFADILQALPHPALLLSETGIVVGYNQKAHEHWENLRRGSHLSSSIRQPALLDAVTTVGGSGKPVTVNYTERVPVERRIEATVAQLPAARRANPNGPAILVSLRDLSEQERLNQMRADFVANASHELRTPLSSLSGFIETLQGPARNDEGAHDKFLGIMAAQAQRMTRLIDDLLSLSRVEMNVHLQPTDVVDLRDTVGHVAESLGPVAKEASMKLVVDVPDEPVCIRGDRDELVQLFQNLIQNAIKYGRKRGRIEFSIVRAPLTGQGRRRVTVSVQDKGPGIAPEHLPRLTERFYRVDVASSREKGGTGLGLAIVKHIAMRHRGELHIESKPGKGSTFSVHFEELTDADTDSAAGATAKSRRS